MPCKTILIVDDDPDQAELLAEVLAGEDRRILAFADPVRAVAALEDERPDLLLADLAMPWVGGEDVVSSARQGSPGLAIFLVSGHPKGDEIAARHGVRFFAKPLDFANLLQAVNEALR